MTSHNPAQLHDAARSFANSRNWTLETDLTETASGEATPVYQVRTERGLAVLRTCVNARAAAGYEHLSGSGVTPELLDTGTSLEAGRWVLVEWIEGIPVLDLSVTPNMDDLQKLTGEVYAAAKPLYAIPAPDGINDAEVERAQRLEMNVASSMKMMKSTPPLTSITRELWDPAWAIHGDLLPQNVIRTTGGGLRLIDLAGGFGPIEADAGRWMAFIADLHLAMSGSLDEAITSSLESIDEVLALTPHLNRARLRGWTAVHLVDLALAMQRHGESWGKYRAVVALGGGIYPMSSSPGTVNLGLNRPCPCGSGRKFKRCCGKDAPRAGSQR